MQIHTHYSIAVKSTPSTTMIGRGRMYHLDDEEMHKVNLLLSTNGSSTLQTSLVRSYDKAFVKGITFYSQRYTRVKKRNSFTVVFEDPLDHSSCYGVVETFISVADTCNIALVKQCVLKQVGPPYDFHGVISDDSRALLFEDYITYEYGAEMFVFVHNLKNKCFNLTYNDWNVLTPLVNTVECE